MPTSNLTVYFLRFHGRQGGLGPVIGGLCEGNDSIFSKRQDFLDFLSVTSLDRLVLMTTHCGPVDLMMAHCCPM